MIQLFKSVFQKPYETDSSAGTTLKSAIGVSLFIVLFFLIFTPFGFDQLDKLSQVKLVCAFSVVNSLSIFIVNIGIRKLFPKLWSVSSWTIGKECLSFLLLFLIIALLGQLTAAYLIDYPLSLERLLILFLIVIAVAIIPIGFSILLKYNRKLKLNLIKSSELTKKIRANRPEIVQDNSILLFNSKNKSESFELPISQLLFCKSAGNYVQVFALVDKNLEKKIIRTTLSELQTEFDKYSQLIRVHRAYLVNLNAIQKVSGNAREFLLFFNENVQSVPVSRKSIKEIKSFFESE